MSDPQSNDRHAAATPPWEPPSLPAPVASTLEPGPAPRSGGRRRLAAVVAVSALAAAVAWVAVDRVGGDDEPVAAAATPSTTPPSADDTDEGSMSSLISCLERELGIEVDPTTGLPAFDDLTGLDPAQLGNAMDACSPEIDDALGSLPGVGDVLGELPPLGELADCLGPLAGELQQDLVPTDGTVVVMGPDGPTVLTFGDGDGSITVRRQDGEVTVEQDGDVQTLDPSAGAAGLDESFDELLDRAVADLEACGVQVPGD